MVAVVNGPKDSGPHPFLMELVGAGVDGIALPLESLDTAAHAFGLQNASSESVDKQVSTFIPCGAHPAAMKIACIDA